MNKRPIVPDFFDFPPDFTLEPSASTARLLFRLLPVDALSLMAGAALVLAVLVGDGSAILEAAVEVAVEEMVDFLISDPPVDTEGVGLIVAEELSRETDEGWMVEDRRSEDVEG